MQIVHGVFLKLSKAVLAYVSRFGIKDIVDHSGVKALQVGKPLSFGPVETQEGKFEGLRYSAHASSIHSLVERCKIFSRFVSRPHIRAVHIIDGGRVRNTPGWSTGAAWRQVPVREQILQRICRYFAGRNQATGVRWAYAYAHLW
jgi:hypothetical protein